MADLLRTAGIVLLAAPAGDYDKRLVILTRERGKITAFARGAKRPGSLLRAAANPFVLGEFILREGRDAYTLYSAEVRNYFEELSSDVENACFASYFCEFADYYGREGIEGTGMLNLLYQSFRALLNPSVPNTLARRIFELKIMVLNGEYTADPPGEVPESCRYAWEYVRLAPLEKLYTFTLNEETFAAFSRSVEKNKQRFVDREFRSLEVLSALFPDAGQ